MKRNKFATYENVSVPLSGLTSVNFFLIRLYYLYSSSFRPLIGVNFCKHATVSLRTLRGLVSVPLSGLTSVNDNNVICKYCGKNSFRPLIGVNFCKHLIFKFCTLHHNQVSVPLSGLTSVNLFNIHHCIVH